MEQIVQITVIEGCLYSGCLFWLSHAVCKYLFRYSRFQSVGNITLHFPDNFGGDATQIHYIGLKGEATQVTRVKNV